MTDEREATPEYYADQSMLQLTPYGVILKFGVAEGEPDGSVGFRPSVNLRMSLEHCKVLAVILKRALVTYEQDNQLEIPLPQPILESMGIDFKRDWLPEVKPGDE